MRVISFEFVEQIPPTWVLVVLNGDECRGQWQQSVISKWHKQWRSLVLFLSFFSPPRYCAQVVWRGRWELWFRNVAGQTRESGFALAGNGYLRSWKWSGPFWHFHSPAGKSNLQQKGERLKKWEGGGGQGGAESRGSDCMGGLKMIGNIRFERGEIKMCGNRWKLFWKVRERCERAQRANTDRWKIKKMDGIKAV